MCSADPVISVIIPVFREERAVGQAVENVRRVLRSFDYSFEIIVVDDGSDDTSAEKARRAGARVISHPYNMGNGASIKTGIRHACGQIMVMMDGDGQHDPDDIPRLLEMIGPYDMVVGARSKKSETKFYRDLANWVYNSFASYVCAYRIEDLTSGFRVIKSSIARSFVSLLPDRKSVV